MHRGVNNVLYDILKGRMMSNSGAEVTTAVGAVARDGAKNKINVTNTGQSSGNATLTVSDGVITITVSSAMATTVTFILGDLEIVKGQEYILSGCPTGGGTSGTYMLGLRKAGATTTAYIDTGGGVDFTAANNEQYDARIVVFKNCPAGTYTFYPMLRYSEIKDSTFVPYAPTNRELYEMILEMKE